MPVRSALNTSMAGCGLDCAGLVAIGREAMQAWQLERALEAFDAALTEVPNHAAAHYLRGETLFLLRRMDEALAAHATALRLGLGDDPQARGRAMSGIVPGDFAWMSHMLKGDFESAWRFADRERGWRTGCKIDFRHLPRHQRPVWNGASVAGKRVLVRCYHGLGDTIQFIRFVPLLARQANGVCVEAQPELLPLFSDLPGVDRLAPLPPEDLDPEAYGCEVELDVTELAHALRIRLDTIPAEVPYLAAPARPSRQGGPLRVGLVWAAGVWKPERSLRAADLEPLGEVPGVVFVSLQRGPEYERWRLVRDGPGIAEEARCDDVAATAGMLSQLDLVISVDTMVAHLAGALGVPVWTLLHYAADWRWLLDRTDSPWYRTMRLFRQRRPGDWADVVREVAAALAAFAAAC